MRLLACLSTFLLGLPSLMAQPVAHRVENLDATPAGWVYFSLRENGPVVVIDEADDDWDLAFNSVEVRVNGTGQYVDEAFDALDEAPAGGYEAELPTGSGQGWYLYQFDTHTVIPIPDRVLVLRTRDGKYAKVQFLSFYRDSPDGTPSGPPRYYTFRYVFQPDGTRSFTR
ncbi:HmuY family protein [Rhodocaloribacter litoris]|uniref:HmuY family protein n=1 Tax=Rhodocaloribacter litoris TaxID=2558931 RepID=UPI001420A979|nr:HmuY family protein [Rhodocaloribacter litoris]QXD16482.1 HmuY family protein [Rhodocaloribacter litoris]